MKARTLLVSVAIGAISVANAHEQIYYGRLLGSKEVPSNDSAGQGFVKVIIDLDEITMRVIADFAGMTGNSTAAHIHIGNGPGTNGGVATMTPSFTGFPLGVRAGHFDATYDLALASTYNPSYVAANGGTIGGAFNTFITKLAQGKGYFNIHTTSFGGGELRANLASGLERFFIPALGAAN